MTRLEEKMGAQLAGKAPAPSGQKDRVDYSTLTVYESEEFGAIRTAVSEDGEPLFSAADVARVLGYRDTNRITRLMGSDEMKTHDVGVGRGGRPTVYLTEPGLYHAIMNRDSGWVKDPEKRSAVQRFQRWVTHEVLPSIRRTGGYMATSPDETPDQLMARALIVAQEALQRRDAVIAEQAAAIEERDRSIALQDGIIARTEKQMEAMAPKALFADAVASSDRCVLVRDLAKIVRQNGVEVGEKRLFVWLRDKGYLIKSGRSKNMPTQRSMEMGLFCVKETAITHSDGHVTINRTPMVTGKGQVYFVAKLCGRDSPRQLAIDGVTS